MSQAYNINCQLGDFIRYYTSLPNATVYKFNKLPTDFAINVNQNDDKTDEYHIIITDGLVNEFDDVRMTNLLDNDKRITIMKRLKVCKSKKYAIHIEYKKSGDEILYCNFNVYMEDTSDLDKMYSEIPNDIYFW